MKPDFSNFIYNSKNKFVFAYVPKVACSNWKCIMRYMAGFENYLDTRYAHDPKISGLEYLSDKPLAMDIINNNDIKKIACVRDPYSRVLSAYINKVESRINKIGIDPIEQDVFLKITCEVDKFRKDKLDTLRFPKVNFEVFLRWIAESGSWFTNNEHWIAQSDLLHLDIVSYDLIGRFENLATDAEEILKTIRCDLKFPSQKQIKFSPTGAMDKVQVYYNEFCYNLVNSIYIKDFLNFGYAMRSVKQGTAPVSILAESNIPTINEFYRNGKKCRQISYPAGEHELHFPIMLGSFDILEGAGKNATLIKVIGTFSGPVIRTEDLKHHCIEKTWLAVDGIPIRFSIRNLTIDLSDWEPEEDTFAFKYGNLSSCAVGLYGKSFEIDNLTITNCPGSGLISIGSVKGGKKDFYKDSPEALIDNLEVINTRDHGVVFAGPHDAMLKHIIVAHSKQKGVYIIADKAVSGACDIDFIHAYATDNIAIHIHCKVKARFLQGDTGRYGGVVLGGTDQIVVEVIEAFKTRGDKDPAADSKDYYNVHVDCSEAQIGIVRIRADAGANGLHIGGFGNIINSLHVNAGGVHSDFASLNIIDPPLAVAVKGNQNKILDARIIKTQIAPIACVSETPVKRFIGKFTVESSGLIDKTTKLQPDGFLDSDIEIINYRGF